MRWYLGFKNIDSFSGNYTLQIKVIGSHQNSMPSDSTESFAVVVVDEHEKDRMSVKEEVLTEGKRFCTQNRIVNFNLNFLSICSIPFTIRYTVNFHGHNDRGKTASFSIFISMYSSPSKTKKIEVITLKKAKIKDSLSLPSQNRIWWLFDV